MPGASSVQPLMSLGFTSLEAQVYTFLLQEPAVTGYRIAQALRKPAPNIYKAIESLETKGAVLVDEAKSRLCRPVPPEELLGHLERRFREDRGKAARLLSGVSAPPNDDHVYTLRSPDQVMERARRMLSRCQDVALVDAFPVPLAELAKDIAGTAGRGVPVAVKAYQPVDIEGARVIVDPRATDAFERWPGQWINVVVDGSEHLIAFLSKDGTKVRQAVWSGSAYLSWVYHCGLASEITLDAVERRLGDGANADDSRKMIGDMTSLKAIHAAGYRRLARRFSDGGSSPKGEAP